MELWILDTLRTHKFSTLRNCQLIDVKEKKTQRFLFWKLSNDRNTDNNNNFEQN